MSGDQLRDLLRRSPASSGTPRGRGKHDNIAEIDDRNGRDRNRAVGAFLFFKDDLSQRRGGDVFLIPVVDNRDLFALLDHLRNFVQRHIAARICVVEFAVLVALDHVAQQVGELLFLHHVAAEAALDFAFEQSLEQEHSALEQKVVAAGKRAGELEQSLLELATRFCAPLRQRPELAALFTELETESAAA